MEVPLETSPRLVLGEARPLFTRDRMISAGPGIAVTVTPPGPLDLPGSRVAGDGLRRAHLPRTASC